MKKLLLLTPFFLLATGLFAQLSVTAEAFASGLDKPVDITHCGDERLFIVERDGAIRIVQPNGSVLSTPFLDIDPLVNSSPNERGLLGLAFHPDYLNNGYFFVNYIKGNGDSRVSRFTVSANDPNVADPNSEMTIFEVPQFEWNHNGGCLKFGPDGYLYASFGDGGGGGDPQETGQNRNTFLGKMLRIDVDGGSPYAVPADNPFVDDPNTLDEIWALGLRNPWRVSFDRVTGDLWIGDVGQNEWEEIDFQPASSPGGENYGWDCYEGNHVYETAGCPNMSELTFPVFEYENTGAVGCSVTGGFVYRGCEFPELYGHYLCADYCSGRIWRVTPDGNGGWDGVEIANLVNNQFSAFGENADGQLFIAQHGSGQISKIVASGELLTATDESCMGMSDGGVNFTIPTDQFASVMWSDGSTEANRSDLNPGIYDVTVTTANGCEFTGNAEVNPGPGLGQPLSITVASDSLLSIPDVGANSYQWYLDGEAIPGADETTYTAQENGLYSVVVSFGGNCEFSSDEVNVMVVSGILETLGLSEFSLTPNPFDQSLRLQFSASQKADVEVVVQDLNGKEVMRETAVVNGRFSKTYDLSGRPAGVYFFKLKTQQGEWSERVVKR